MLSTFALKTLLRLEGRQGLVLILVLVFQVGFHELLEKPLIGGQSGS